MEFLMIMGLIASVLILILMGVYKLFCWKKDYKHLFWMAFGTVFAPLGLILFFVWNSKHPKRAKAVLTGFEVSALMLGIIITLTKASMIYDLIKEKGMGYLLLFM